MCKKSIVAILFIIAAAFLTNSSVTAQNLEIKWTRVYPGTIYMTNEAFAKTDDGYTLVGTRHTWGPTNSGAYIVRTDAVGDTIWTRTYDFDTYAISYSAFNGIGLSDGSFLLCGDSIGTTRCGMIMKLDNSGDSLWTRTYPVGNENLYFWSIKETSDGGYTMVGSQSTYGKQFQEAVYKTDASGTVTWSQTFGGDRNDNAEDVIELSDGSGYVVLGTTESRGTGAPDEFGNHYSNINLIKFDEFGISQWDTVYGEDKGEVARCLKETSDGGLIMVGETWSFDPPNHRKLYLLKTDLNGDSLWAKVYVNAEGTPLGSGFCVDEVPDQSGYYVMGIVTPDQLWLLRTDTDGDTLWTQTFDIGTNEYPRQMIIEDNGDITVMGLVKIGPSANPHQMYLMRIGQAPLDVAEENSIIPERALTTSNYPNPFNPSTTIEFTLRRRADVKIDIYNILGERIKTLAENKYSAGQHQVIWDGRDKAGQKSASGIYFYRVKADREIKINKMVLLK